MDIDFAVLADHAEVVAGKLYLMGGGWDTWFAQETPVHLRVALAVGVRVGWEETNRAIPVNVRIEDDDGQALVQINAQVNVGRPPHLPPGSTQLAQLAANVGFQVARHGGYRAVVTAGEAPSSIERQIPFRVLPRS